MKKKLFVFAALLLSLNFVMAQEDYEGCKDHPMFNRMPNFHIASCEHREFDAFKFTVENSINENAKKETVEGKFYLYNYTVNEGVGSPPSAIQILKNFENALKTKKATIICEMFDPSNSISFFTTKITNGNSEVWVLVETWDSEYKLTIVERQAMIQVIQANDILEALNNEGYIALDILFDTGKSSIKKDSEAIIEEIYTLLQSNPSLNVSIEGHTDNVGNTADNKNLSDSRAKVVANSLVTKGIAADRLSSLGWGQEKPVADNRTEEGRKKNRRVEIVKK